MKVEYVYAVRPGSGRPPAARSVPVYYYYTGEVVAPGYYVCTFCGHRTTITRARALTPCQHCDSAEFSTLEAAA